MHILRNHFRSGNWLILLEPICNILRLINNPSGLIHYKFENMKHYPLIRNLALMLLAGLVVQGCRSISQQTRQLKALEKCKYEVLSADSMLVAGTDPTRMIRNKTIELARVPAIALALLRKDVPFEARLNIGISNPSSDLAAINQFDYVVLVKNQEIAQGSVNQQIRVAPGETIGVPVRIHSNIYSLLSNGRIMEQIADFIEGGALGTEKKTTITVKIKPTIEVGNKLVKYPGYITIDKEISSKIFF
jgi:hypothetical protein